MNHRHSRRTLLKSTLGTGALLSAPPVLELLSLIAGESLAHAEGTVNPEAVVNYIAVSLFGAPHRWCYDQFLQTQASDSIVFNPYTATAFGSSTSASGLEYKTFMYGTVPVPHIWSTSVPNGGGGQRPMSDLLNHMINIRGYGSGIDGHGNNFAAQLSPVPSVGSITGHRADNSSTLFRAVQFPPNISSITNFSAPKGAGITALHDGGDTYNVVSALMNPFLPRATANHTVALRDKYKTFVNQAFNVLKTKLSNRDPATNSITADLDSALNRMTTGVDDLDQVWSALYTKYNTIATTAFKDLTVSGLTNREIIANYPNTREENVYRIEAFGGIHPAQGLDIRTIISNVRLGMMARSFALVEFVLTRKLSSAIEIGELAPTNFKGMFSNIAGQPVNQQVMRTFSFNFDQHRTGAVSSLLMSTCFYRSLSACLLELIDQLKAKQLFDKTVFHIITEFGRTPRNTLGGSDHGFDAMVTSLITGMQTSGPMILGNIIRNGSGGKLSSTYSGTFGYKAPVNLDGNQTLLTQAHVASSLAVLLGLPHNPWANLGAPLVTLDGGRAKSRLPIGELA